MRFNVIDLETTGFSTEEDRIIEIGVVKFENAKEIGRMSSLINPLKPRTLENIEANKISEESLKTAPLIQEVLPSILNFCGDDFNIGHNLKHFDRRFINHAIKTVECESPSGLVYCSLELAKKAIPKEHVMNYKLGTLLEYFKIPVKQTLHRADADAFYNGLLALSLFKLLGIKNEAQLQSFCNPLTFDKPPTQRSLF